MDWYVSFLISIASIAGTVQGFHSQGRCLSRGLLCATAKCERTFQFVPYGSTFDLKTKKSICVDGLVQGTDLHLSHWSGNKTPKHYLSDLSLECAFKFIEMEQENSEWKDAVVVNNHFDTDGLLSAWALLEPEKALAHKDKMLAAAAAGDFDEWGVSDRGLQLNFAILNMAKSASAEDGDAYKLILPEVADLLSNINKREDLWGDDMARLREFDDLWADDIIQGYRVIDDKVIPELCVGSVQVGLVHATPLGCLPLHRSRKSDVGIDLGYVHHYLVTCLEEALCEPTRCRIISKCQHNLRTEAEAVHWELDR